MESSNEILLDAMKNAFSQLIGVMHQELDLVEVDPEKMKISASVYRLAMEDAIAINNEIQRLEAGDETDEDKKESFFSVEGKIK